MGSKTITEDFRHDGTVDCDSDLLKILVKTPAESFVQLCRTATV